MSKTNNVRNFLRQNYRLKRKKKTCRWTTVRLCLRGYT